MLDRHGHRQLRPLLGPGRDPHAGEPAGRRRLHLPGPGDRLDGTPNTDPSPATETFTVDTPPDTIIDSAAHGTTSDTTPSFAFHSTEAGSSFECSIDTGIASFGPCSGPGATHTPASPLADGAYTFRVRATDSDGTPNTDASPATEAFTVDTVVDTPPDTIIDSAAHGTTSDTTPSFAFHSTEAGSSFECSIDTGTASFGPCSGPGATHTPASPLADGSYTFRVRATDSDGTPNTDASPATEAFTVSTVVVPPTPTPECDGQTATIVGTEGNDVLNGTKRADVIVGLGGKDQINAKKGNDLVCAGAGKDHVVGGPGADDLFGEGGDDLLNGNKGADRLNGGPGEDRCNGGGDTDTTASCEH